MIKFIKGLKIASIVLLLMIISGLTVSAQEEYYVRVYSSFAEHHQNEISVGHKPNGSWIQYNSYEEIYFTTEDGDDLSFWTPSTVSGSTFVHWYDLENDVVLTTDRDLLYENIDRNYHITPIYDPHGYALKLDANVDLNLYGETFEIQYTGYPTVTDYPIDLFREAGDSGSITAPASFDGGNYNFLHWWDNYNDEVYSSSETINITSLDRDYDLTAIYQLPVEYDIILDANVDLPTYDESFAVTTDGYPTVEAYPIDITRGEGISGSVTAPLSFNGHTFIHWWDNENNEIYGTDNTFTVTSLDRDYDLTAIYQLPVEYDIILDANVDLPTYGESFTVTTDGYPTVEAYPIDITRGEGTSGSVTAPLSFNGHTFIHWWDNENNEIYGTDNTFTVTSLDRDYDLTAIYQLPAEYTIYLVANVHLPDFGQTFEVTTDGYPTVEAYPIDIIRETGTSGSVTAPLSFNGHTFIHWWDNENNEIYETDNTFTITSLDRDYFLTAIYQLPTYVSATVNYETEFISNEQNLVLYSQGGHIFTGYPISSIQLQQGNDLEVIAPQSFAEYEFQYWYDTINEEIITYNNFIYIQEMTEDDYDFMAVYSLFYSLVIDANIDLDLQEFSQFNLTGPNLNETFYSFNQAIEGDLVYTAIAPVDGPEFFGYWFDNNSESVVSTEPTLNFTLDDNHDFTAHYGEIHYSKTNSKWHYSNQNINVTLQESFEVELIKLDYDGNELETLRTFESSQLIHSFELSDNFAYKLYIPSIDYTLYYGHVTPAPSDAFFEKDNAVGIGGVVFNQALNSFDLLHDRQSPNQNIFMSGDVMIIHYRITEDYTFQVFNETEQQFQVVVPSMLQIADELGTNNGYFIINLDGSSLEFYPYLESLIDIQYPHAVGVYSYALVNQSETILGESIYLISTVEEEFTTTQNRETIYYNRIFNIKLHKNSTIISTFFSNQWYRDFRQGETINLNPALLTNEVDYEIVYGLSNIGNVSFLLEPDSYNFTNVAETYRLDVRSQYEASSFPTPAGWTSKFFSFIGLESTALQQASMIIFISIVTVAMYFLGTPKMILYSVTVILFLVGFFLGIIDGGSILILTLLVAIVFLLVMNLGGDKS